MSTICCRSRPQDVRAEGRRRTLRALEGAARATHPDHPRWRARARHAIGHAQRPGIVGFGKAAELGSEHADESQRIAGLRRRLHDGITRPARRGLSERPPGAPASRQPEPELRLRGGRVDAHGPERPVHALASSASMRRLPCRRGGVHVGDARAVVRLKALGVGEDLAPTSIRFGLGRSTPKKTSTTSWIGGHRGSPAARPVPLYEMAKEGSIWLRARGNASRRPRRNHGLQRQGARSYRTRATWARSTGWGSHVGTGVVGAPECGDVMKLQLRIRATRRRGTRSSRRSAAGARCQLELRHRALKGRRSRKSRDQEHAHREELSLPPREDPLLGARRDGSRRRLPTEEEA